MTDVRTLDRIDLDAVPAPAGDSFAGVGCFLDLAAVGQLGIEAIND